MKFINDFLKKRKLNKIRKKISRLQERMVYFQRNGNLNECAKISGEIDTLKIEIKSIDKDNEKQTPQRSNNKESHQDFIDYDGMGDQGRFPEVKKKR